MPKAEELEYHVFRDEDSLRFVQGLSSRDPQSRRQAMDSISNTIEAWLDGFGSPKEHSIPENCNGNGCANGFELIDDFTNLIKEHLPELLGLSLQAPFSDVRDGCSRIIHELKERGIKVPRSINSGPSNFIPESEVVPIYDNANEDDLRAQTQSLFVDAFLHRSRVDHTTQLMGYHPQYLDCFLRTQQYLMQGDGPLPYEYRHYIALMAAGRHQCSYTIHMLQKEFLLHSGDPKWLQGLDNVPQKLRDLYNINKLLAHRPWLVDRSHIEKLTRGKDNWSLSELMHALSILTHFHALSSFVYGCGINPEIDEEGGHTFRPPSLTSDNNNETKDLSTSPASCDGVKGIEDLIGKMKQLEEEAAEEEYSQEELLIRFEKVGVQCTELQAAVGHPSPQADVLRYVEDPGFTYQDFAKRGQENQIPTFRAQDYSWEDHGFSLANRLYPEIGSLLDDKFKCAYTLTYYTMGPNKDVDTSSFRCAIWNYIHCMYGIRHDDYDYGEVNQLIGRSLKSYIKTATCYPERITKQDYDGFMKGFKHSEKVHVNLMLLEARMQAELLYSLRAIMRYMT